VLDILSNATLLTPDLQEAILYMQTADILIHTGSSLTYAAYMTGSQSGLMMESQPKELMMWPTKPLTVDTYHLLSAVYLDLDGKPVSHVGQQDESGCVRRYVNDLYKIKRGDSQANLQIYQRLIDKLIIGDLDNSTYGLWLEMVTSVSKMKGSWVVRLFYNSSAEGVPLNLFRYQAHVELIDNRVLGVYAPGYKYLTLREAHVAGMIFVSFKGLELHQVECVVAYLTKLLLYGTKNLYVLDNSYFSSVVLNGIVLEEWKNQQGSSTHELTCPLVRKMFGAPP
jgi:hypothetical protein